MFFLRSLHLLFGLIFIFTTISCSQVMEISQGLNETTTGSTPEADPTFVIARVAYEGRPPELSLDRANLLASQFQVLMKRVSYGRVNAKVVVTDALPMPMPASYYSERSFYRITRDVLALLRRVHPEIVNISKLEIFGEHVWKGTARGKGTINGVAAVLAPNGAGPLDVFMAHEGGHSFGFDHAGSTTYPFGGMGEEYGDILHIMGGYQRCYKSSGYDAYYHPWRAVMMGWIPEENIKDAKTLAGNVRLTDVRDPDISKPGHTAAIVIRKNEYHDYWMIKSHGKIFIHQVHHVKYAPRPETNPLLTHNLPPVETTLLDMTPNSDPEFCKDMQDANLGIGQTFSENDISLTPVFDQEELKIQVQAGVNAMGFEEDRIPQFTIETTTNRPFIVTDGLKFEVKLPSGVVADRVEIKIFNLNDAINAYARRVISKEPPALAESGPLSGPSYQWSVNPS